MTRANNATLQVLQLEEAQRGSKDDGPGDPAACNLRLWHLQKKKPKTSRSRYHKFAVLLTD